MKLSGGLENIRKIFPHILNGKHLDHFNDSQINNIIEIGFLLNNISIVDNQISFEYNGFGLEVVGAEMMEYFSQEYYEDAIISSIKNNENFQKALKSFKLDHNLTKLI